jgi:hypothetical protein
MSNEDQMAVIGKLVTERAQAKREMALLITQIKQYGPLINTCGAELVREQPPTNLRKVLGSIDGIIQKGGIDTLRVMLMEYVALEDRVVSATQSLHAAGAE